MGPQTAARALVLMGVLVLVLIGLAFASYAVFLAFSLLLSPLGAAAMMAIILLALPAIWIVAVALRSGEGMPEKIDNNTLAALANIAKDKPLFAILLAGIVGAANAINERK